MYYKGQPCIIRFTKGELNGRNYLVKSDDWNNVAPMLRYLCRGNHDFNFMTVDITEEIERKIYPIIPVITPADIDRSMLKVIDKIRTLADKNFNAVELEQFEDYAMRIMELYGRFYKTHIDGKQVLTNDGFQIESSNKDDDDNG